LCGRYWGCKCTRSYIYWWRTTWYSYCWWRKNNICTSWSSSSLVISWGLLCTYSISSSSCWLSKWYWTWNWTRTTRYRLCCSIECYLYIRYWTILLRCRSRNWEYVSCSYWWWIICYWYCWWRKNNSCTSWSSSRGRWRSFCTILRYSYSLSSSSCLLSKRSSTRTSIYCLSTTIRCYFYIRYRSILLWRRYW